MNTNFLKKHHKAPLYVLGFAACFIILNIVSLHLYLNFLFPDDTTSESDQISDTGTMSDCNVLGINMHGDLWTYIPEGNENDTLTNKDVVASEEIVSSIIQAEADDNIKAIVIESDSSGGLPVAGEEIAQALQKATKPTVALIRQSGASAAYWAVSGADYIFASKNSDVGSIGVTMSYLDNVAKNQKEGLQYVQLSVGKYKDMMNIDKPLTAEEKALAMRDLKIVHQNFINDVAANRKLPVDKVVKLADGSSMMGEMAKSAGLIDEIGGIFEVNKYLETKIGASPVTCWQ